MANLRFFFAVPLPDEVRSWMDEAIPKDAFQGARWVPSEDRHVTLRFLGDVPEERVEAVRAVGRAAAAEAGPALIGVTGLGVFPTLRLARVLWLGLRDDERSLEAVENRLSEALDPLGWSPEERAYTPHITLARFEDPLRIAALPEVPSAAPLFRVESFCLYRSRTGPGGSRYEVIGAFPLA